MEEIKRLYERVNACVGQEIVGGERVIRLSVIALLVGGHILVDDVPGTGKTTFAKAFAASLSLDMRRLQCTPDLLPSDMTGVNYFDMKSSEFLYQSASCRRDQPCHAQNAGGIAGVYGGASDHGRGRDTPFA